MSVSAEDYTHTKNEDPYGSTCSYKCHPLFVTFELNGSGGPYERFV